MVKISKTTSPLNLFRKFNKINLMFSVTILAIAPTTFYKKVIPYKPQHPLSTYPISPHKHLYYLRYFPQSACTTHFWNFKIHINKAFTFFLSGLNCTHFVSHHDNNKIKSLHVTDWYTFHYIINNCVTNIYSTLLRLFLRLLLLPIYNE